jgi:hypothetical protein
MRPRLLCQQIQVNRGYTGAHYVTQNEQQYGCSASGAKRGENHGYATTQLCAHDAAVAVHLLFTAPSMVRISSLASELTSTPDQEQNETKLDQRT